MLGLGKITRLFDPVRIHLLFASRAYSSEDLVEMAIQVVTRDRLEITIATAELVVFAAERDG